MIRLFDFFIKSSMKIEVQIPCYLALCRIVNNNMYKQHLSILLSPILTFNVYSGNSQFFHIEIFLFQIFRILQIKLIRKLTILSHRNIFVSNFQNILMKLFRKLTILNITDEIIQETHNSCLNYQYLFVHTKILQMKLFRKLTILNITDEAIQEIGEHCHQLLSLCISSCPRLTDASLVSLGQGCINLRTLEVACCSHFTDNGFQALARITDATLNFLANYCPKISALSLSHCELITDEGIRHVGSGGCATEQLSVLELDNCPLITDASLEHLMGCQGLERIELYDCQLITRAGIRRLRTRLPNIKVHAYFAPVTPPPSVGNGRQRYCKCCVIL
ncbi:hypothetical protein KUTeg_000946 [Tegillarca granosa]|uniref:F-box/LRR-repeat protein 20 n=1 Tax=Tegillarca granosa TaxID=220873 RepID=A0ABQ9FW93_TEGGR|nr:hypothetical protein KUTeg_000946 [Tegillarca granosa]